MMLACDIRIAAPGTTFLWSIGSNGLRPRPSVPVRLTSLVGPDRAGLVLLTGERIGAEETASFDLIDRIVPAEALQGEARRLRSPAIAARREHVATLKAGVP